MGRGRCRVNRRLLRQAISTALILAIAGWLWSLNDFSLGIWPALGLIVLVSILLSMWLLV